ncbi:methylaspartate mutase [Streptomyces sp. NBC_00091]|uniref:methylaspartate mutase n=1 Tax=Streptomyces sp. NBC_00091 TaxID=2975648 RepID=UPI0022586B08|nr:methylaspartate mutase [Streptomyces sp. NBC_00091]MCX5380557.1 methylaspartate mutase [Streptomyces sp. NBC_00091]
MNAPAVRLSPFAEAVNAARAEGRLVVQPRMGFPTTARMREGLLAVRGARARTVGTVTLDSYTRVGDHASARKALDAGADLNGFPIVAHGAAVTREMLAPVLGDTPAGHPFAVQVRHGSANPFGIVETLLDAGLDATEGGPVSYCLPYSRTPLAESVDAWARSCELLAERSHGSAHMESFGGCLLGQLCPPGLLVAMAVLEGIFFRRHGLRSISLSYAQQTHPDQDAEALAALRLLAGEYLGDTDWHVVLYTYMGVFPRTTPGALALLRSSAVLAARTGTERLIVKTPAEAHRIPTVEDNIQALGEAAAQAASARATAHAPVAQGEFGVLAEARALVESVLELGSDIGAALVEAFRRGYLDVPYCLHADNSGRSRSWIDARGSLQWRSAGAMPVRASAGRAAGPLRADDLIGMLSHVQQGFDRAAVEPAGGRRAALAA